MAFGGNDQKWYLDMNPNGVVPTIDDGGRIIWESNSCVRYLAAKYAAGTLWPNDPGQRSEADRWMDWQLTTISECMRVIFWGLIRTPADKRDMAAIKKAAVDAGKLWGGSTEARGQALCRGPALHHGRHPGRLLRAPLVRARRRAARAQEREGVVRAAEGAAGLRQARHAAAEPERAHQLSTHG